MDPKGYETKPWWPYVQNLQEQIDAGGSGGGGGVATLRLNVDAQSGNLVCPATKAEIEATASASMLNLELYTDGTLYQTMKFGVIQPSYDLDTGELNNIDYFSFKYEALIDFQLKIENLFVSLVDPDTPGYVQMGGEVVITSSGSSYRAPQKMSIAFPNF